MLIPRLHLFELEDQPWFPAGIRDLATDYIHFVEITFRLHRPVVALLAQTLRATKADHVIDLCSGGGGPIPALQEALAAGGLDVRFTLTDRFPNLPAFHWAETMSQGRITFVARPVDARAVPKDLGGVRTIFNSFHHFRPTDAMAVLRDATNAGVPIAVFEIPERALLVILYDVAHAAVCRPRDAVHSTVPLASAALDLRSPAGSADVPVGRNRIATSGVHRGRAASPRARRGT